MIVFFKIIQIDFKSTLNCKVKLNFEIMQEFFVEIIEMKLSIANCQEWELNFPFFGSGFRAGAKLPL